MNVKLCSRQLEAAITKESRIREVNYKGLILTSALN